MARERGHMRTWHVCSQHGPVTCASLESGSFLQLHGSDQGRQRICEQAHSEPASLAASTFSALEVTLDEGFSCFPGRVIRGGDLLRISFF